MNSDAERQLRAIFREEATEILDELRVVVGRLRTADARAAREEVAVAMRLAHNLKGAAGSVGLDAIAATAHVLEDALLASKERGLDALRLSVPLFADAIAALETSAAGGGDESLRAIGERLAERAGPASSPEAPPTSHATSGDDEAEATMGAEEPAGDARSEPAPETGEAAPTHDAPEDRAPDAEQRASATVRIDTQRFDRLFGFVSELLVTETDMRNRHEALVAAREGLESAARSVPREARGALDAALRMLVSVIDDHHRSVGAFGRLSSDLHDAMKRARMVPLESLAASLRRTVDEAARSLGKVVELELALGGIELDKVVLDRLRDPLVHLLRNAVDHGIEPPGTRDLVGKPEAGLVVVQAEVEGSTVRIRVADDGRGIDPRRIAKSAVEKGLVTSEAASAMEDGALVDLLFAEGFSTREATTLWSGRGVGLDVVRRAVADFAGNVRATPRGPLGGAAFEVVVPLSVLSTRLLLVRASEVVYGLPIHAIDRVVRAERSATRNVGGTAVVTLDDGRSLPFHHLARVLGGRVVREPEQLRLLLVSHGGSSLAVAVDEVLREEDFVVRKLPWNLVTVPGVSGAVVLPDGSVAVVVDVAGLFARRTVATTGPTEAAAPDRTRILVVDDSMTTRTLHRNLLVGAGYDVVLAHDGHEAWDRLRSEAIDVVVSDVQMPGMDGFELTRRIRSDSRLGSLPVILVTSLARPEDVRRGLDAGADEYVVKGPLEQDALLTAVARHAG